MSIARNVFLALALELLRRAVAGAGFGQFLLCADQVGLFGHAFQCGFGILLRLEGRRFVGAEVDPDTHHAASQRLAQPYTAPLFGGEEQPAQVDLLA